MTDYDSMLLLPPAARAEVRANPLTPAERRGHGDSPLGASAGWYYGFTGSGLLALALHELTGLPLVGVLVAAGEIALGDRPLELMLHAGVWSDGRLLGACGAREASSDGGERLIAVSPERVRDLCAEMGAADPRDPAVAEAARRAARVLLTHLGRLPA